MKKLMAAILAVCMLALVLVSVPQVSAESESDENGAVLVSYLDMAYGDWGYWRGTLTGDIRGTIRVDETPRNFIVGDVEYFFETFTITTSRGVIEGSDEGVYNLTTYEFWAHGLITEATGHWSFLVGDTLFEWGVTSAPSTLPITAHRVPFVLLPAQPESADDTPLLVSYLDMAYGDWGYWRGTLTGDIRGTIRVDETPRNYLVGDVEYFFEVFTVTTHRGIIQGFDAGVYNLTTGDFWAYGRITDASSPWAKLVGDMLFEWGSTSTFGVLPMTAQDVPFVLMEL